ncbi:MAG: hypothetical protein BGO43_09005 [Gammaproteobacteria bacterium 39-13]|nr:hypothetical protein [Gammaproteobacteria bacterium]OJV94378.1 MAG: hypothetical protein BGO43_09005 [Gammaproteobacteria bacterium 39-13]
MKNVALYFSGIVFFFLMFMHIVRYIKGWEIVIAQHNIPLDWSIFGAIVAALIAFWMFVAARK